MSNIEPGAVILESTFRSTAQIAKEIFPILPVGPFLTHRFETEDKVAHIESPLLIVHGREDSIIPFHHGEYLFEQATEPKRFLEIHGDHNDGWYVSRDLYRQTLSEFVDPLFP